MSRLNQEITSYTKYEEATEPNMAQPHYRIYLFACLLSLPLSLSLFFSTYVPCDFSPELHTILCHMSYSLLSVWFTLFTYNYQKVIVANTLYDPFVLQLLKFLVLFINYLRLPCISKFLKERSY